MENGKRDERERMALLCQYAAGALDDVMARDDTAALLREVEWRVIHEAHGALREAVKRLLEPPAPERPFFDVAQSILGYREG